MVFKCFLSNRMVGYARGFETDDEFWEALTNKTAIELSDDTGHFWAMTAHIVAYHAC